MVEIVCVLVCSASEHDRKGDVVVSLFDHSSWPVQSLIN